jgi:ABC-type transport system involved in multi-copper enzyme maturation permease subunit
MAHAILRCLSLPGGLTGPIFGKELRVASRRRRNYVLRFAYVVCLAAFMVLVWLSTVRFSGNAVRQRAQMAEAGKQIVSTTVLFQFVATQILAVIMLSTAISDEIYHRTLGLLMTTSISSLQIVMGKLLSKLLQLILLVAITLPILAIVRVFGGVPWMYLLSSLCITLSAAIFAGSLSLLFSIAGSRAYGVIIRTAFVLACIYLILPTVFDPVTWGPFGSQYRARSAAYPWVSLILLHLNPVAGLWQNTRNMLAPGQTLPFWWPVNCGVMLVASMGLLVWSVRTVRKVALRQACGISDLKSQISNTEPKRASNPQSEITPSQSAPAGPVKRVVGPPVIWKELRAPFVRGVDNRNSYIGLAAAVGAQLITYILVAPKNGLAFSITHTAYGLLFVGLGLIFGIVFSATCITTEKESQSWLLLLGTPLSDWEILLGKAASAFRRTIPIWGLLGGHLLLFTLMGYLHPIVWVQVPIVAAWSSFFAISVGLYFSSRCRHTSSAMVAGLALLFGLWVVGPALAGGIGVIFGHTDLFTKSLFMHPFIQTDLAFSGVVNTTGSALSDLRYDAERFFFNSYQGTLGVGAMMRILIISALVYGIMGTGLLWRAKCHLRRRIF